MYDDILSGYITTDYLRKPAGPLDKCLSRFGVANNALGKPASKTNRIIAWR